MGIGLIGQEPKTVREALQAVNTMAGFHRGVFHGYVVQIIFRGAPFASWPDDVAELLPEDVLDAPARLNWTVTPEQHTRQAFNTRVGVIRLSGRGESDPSGELHVLWHPLNLGGKRGR